MVAKLGRTIRKEKAKIKPPCAGSLMKLLLDFRRRQPRPSTSSGRGSRASTSSRSIADWPQPDTKAELSGFAIAARRPDGDGDGRLCATGLARAIRRCVRGRRVGARVATALAGEGVARTSCDGRARRAGWRSCSSSRGQGAAPSLFRRDSALALEETDVPPAVFTSGRILMLDATDLPRGSCAPRALARAAGIPTMIDVERWTSGALRLSRCRSTSSSRRRRSSPSSPAERDVDLALERLAEPVRWCGGRAWRRWARTGRWPGAREPRSARRPSRVTVVDTTGAGDAFRGGFRLRLAADGAWGGTGGGADLCQPRGRAELSGGWRADGLAPGRRTSKTVCNLGVTRSV